MRGSVLITGRLVAALVASAIGISATCALGFWQLRRAAGKEVLQQQLVEAAAAVPTEPSVEELRHPESLIHRHVSLRGTWRKDRVVYLDNRPQGGQAGFYVLMALAITDPMPADIMVNRGWLPRAANDRSLIAPYRTPDGEVTIDGVVLAEEPRLLELAAQKDRRLGSIWQNFDFDDYARAAGDAPLRFAVRQDPSSAVVGSDGLDRNWPESGGVLQGQIDRHHGYAFQWFALAATLFVLTAWHLFRRTKHDHVRID